MQERVKRSKSARRQTAKVALEIDAALVAAAASKGIDLAALLEQALRAQLPAAISTGSILTESDRTAIEAHDRMEVEHGTWVDDWGKY